MKFKTLLLCAAASAAALSGAAQSHHGFYWIPDVLDTDAYNANDTNADKTLNCWFTPECVMPVPMSDGTLPNNCTTYYNGGADMIVRPTTMNGEKNGYYAKLVGTSVNGTTAETEINDDNFANGYLEITVPSRMDYPRTDPNTPNWVNVTTTNNAMVFHCCLPGKPGRINDAGNSLAYEGGEAYLSDCNGCYVGVKAPAGATVKAYFHTSTMKASQMAADISGEPYNANLEGKVHTMAFDFDATFDGNYKEITSGEPYGALTGKTYVSADWPNGFCVKYLDVVIYGVNPGDVVGFGGIQTLHPDWTPVEFVEGWSAGVEAIGVDNNANAPVEYFNIQGMQVSADNLTPGLYIKRQGTETTKVLVK